MVAQDSSRGQVSKLHRTRGVGRCRGCTAELCVSTEKLREGLWLPGIRLFMGHMSSAEKPNSSGKQGEAVHRRVLCRAITGLNCPGVTVYCL